MNSIQITNSENQQLTDTERERKRCVGIVLAEYGIWKLSGEERIAHILDALATKLEHPDNV